MIASLVEEAAAKAVVVEQLWGHLAMVEERSLVRAPVTSPKNCLPGCCLCCELSEHPCAILLEQCLCHNRLRTL